MHGCGCRLIVHLGCFWVLLQLWLCRWAALAAGWLCIWDLMQLNCLPHAYSGFRPLRCCYVVMLNRLPHANSDFSAFNRFEFWTMQQVIVVIFSKFGKLTHTYKGQGCVCSPVSSCDTFLLGICSAHVHAHGAAFACCLHLMSPRK